MDTYAFDGKKYRAASKHQKKWGCDLLSGISLKGDEHVLDLGCGDGILTEQLARAVPRGKVLGIDASASMIETAKMLERENLSFAHMDINEMDLENDLDLIFSNAALHWVKDHRRLLKNAHRALKPHGKILWEFGGDGNCPTFLDVMKKKIREDRYAGYFKDLEWPWYMPSKQQYTALIEAVGAFDYKITEVARDTHFADAQELIRWIDQPSILPFIRYVPPNLRKTFRREVIHAMIQRTQQPNGAFFESFRRIQVSAQKRQEDIAP